MPPDALLACSVLPMCYLLHERARSADRRRRDSRMVPLAVLPGLCAMNRLDYTGVQHSEYFLPRVRPPVAPSRPPYRNPLVISKARAEIITY